MTKFYFGSFNYNFSLHGKRVIFRRLAKNLYKVAFLICAIHIILPATTFAQKLEFSYSYFNITRNSGGGTLEMGDTIEIHALIKINSSTSNTFYVDTIPTGTKYITKSLKLITNEGLLYSGSGPYTDGSNDDPGVYDASVPGIRVNVGTGASRALSGAGFGNATGGGSILAGNVPKFYGSTLFIVAYQLVVTANNGDTIHPTGNFHIDTAGSYKTVRFDYGGIKVIQNQALCNNYLGASFSAESSFGAGSIQNRSLGVNSPGYSKVNLGANSPQDNYYSVANNTSADGTTNNAGPYKPTTNNSRVFGGFWDIIGDHTGATNTAAGNSAVTSGQPGGYMLVVNAAFTTGEVYRDTIKNVCPNTYYEFSAWVRNICGVCGIDKNSAATYTPGVLPNLTYTINDVDYYTTGNMPHNNTWEKRGFLYKTGPAETSFRITIKNNAAGGGGNDWVLDDINLSSCYPDLVNSPKDTATSCANVRLYLSDTVKSYFNNYTNFCWEKSTDGINWAGTGVCGTKTATLTNGEWVYAVDTSFIPVAADSGTYYRLKVATTASNLTSPNCSVANSQKIFVKIFNVTCALLNTTILNFTGNLEDDRTTLKWTAQNESNLKAYDVEKSTDGIHFVTTGTVTSTNLASADYTFSDPATVPAIAYYRLKLASSSGNDNKYSKTIVLYNPDAALKVTTVNPFRSSLKVEIFSPEDGTVILNLYDLFGKVVSKKSVRLTKGTSQVLMDDIERLSSGMYILRTQVQNNIVQNKLFKVN